MNTKHIINQVRYLEVKEVKKHRSELLNLARWICEYFGYKITKNNPEYAKVSRRFTPCKREEAKLKVNTNWITAFRSKGIHYRYDYPELYNERSEGQRTHTKDELLKRKIIGEIGYFHGVRGNFNRSELATLIEKHIPVMVSMYKIPGKLREECSFWIGNDYKFELEEIETGYRVYLYDYSN